MLQQAIFLQNFLLPRSSKNTKITMVGALPQNRKEITQEIKLNKKDELYISRFLFCSSKNIMICSYKGKWTKNVYLLSSMRNLERVEDEDSKRHPEEILFYNESKGSLDTAHEMLRGCSTKATSWRWPLAAFFGLLDIVCLDAYVICKDVGIENVPRRCFLLYLGEALYDAKRKNQKPSILRVSAVVENHSGYAEPPEKK